MSGTRHGQESSVGGVGAVVRRHSDPALITGHATFIDDIEPHGTLHVAMVRSPFAHAVIKGVDASAALELPGGAVDRRRPRARSPSPRA